MKRIVLSLILVLLFSMIAHAGGETQEGGVITVNLTKNGPDWYWDEATFGKTSVSNWNVGDENVGVLALIAKRWSEETGVNVIYEQSDKD